MIMKNKEILEKLRTYQIGVIRSVIASRQGRLGTYSADAIDRERLADTDGLADEEYYESPLTIKHDGLYRNVISLEFCEDGLMPVCLMDGWDGDDFPLPLENLSCRCPSRRAWSCRRGGVKIFSATSAGIAPPLLLNSMITVYAEAERKRADEQSSTGRKHLAKILSFDAKP